MKNVIKFLPVMAFLLASGLALATTKTTMAPQFYKNSSGEWRSLSGDGIVVGTGPGQYSCDSSENQCTSEGLDGQTPTGEITTGALQPNTHN